MLHVTQWGTDCTEGESHAALHSVCNPLLRFDRPSRRGIARYPRRSFCPLRCGRCCGTATRCHLQPHSPYQACRLKALPHLATVNQALLIEAFLFDCCWARGERITGTDIGDLRQKAEWMRRARQFVTMHVPRQFAGYCPFKPRDIAVNCAGVLWRYLFSISQYDGLRLKDCDQTRCGDMYSLRK